MLGDRVGWLAVVSVITGLGSSQLLYEFGDHVSYADSVHAASLAAFSVVFFATVAGSLGAYFLENRDRPTRRD